MKTFASLFTGFGLADVGAKQAGFTPIWGIENDPHIHVWGNEQLGGHVECVDVLQCLPEKYERPDLLHASPPCPNFSKAKQGAKETPHDLALARSVAAFISTLTPQSFTLENVFQYMYSKSFKIIACALEDAGYFWVADVINAADYGVPQTRKRLWLRAERANLLAPLPAPQAWQGWYAAIADLVPTLPESKFANWQLKRLPDFIPMRGFLVGGSNTSAQQAAPNVGVSTEQEQTRVVTAHSSRSWKAFIVDGFNTHETKTHNNNGNRMLTVRAEQEPIFTISASQTKISLRALLEHGRVVAMTPRALARFQTMPDDYALPDKKILACKGIGNGVPCALYKIIAEHSGAWRE